MDASFLGFLAVATVVIVTPGQDTALTIRNTLLGGRRAGIDTALGVATGQSIWTIATSLGLTALLLASGPAFELVRWLGVAYLVYLGIVSLRSAIRPGPATPTTAPVTGPTLDRGRAWRQGLLSSLGNPKLAVFFSSLLPQFAAPGGAAFATMLGLGALFVVMTLTWLSLYAVVVARAGDVLRRGRVRRVLDGLLGGVMLAFGARLATQAR